MTELRTNVIRRIWTVIVASFAVLVSSVVLLVSGCSDGELSMSCSSGDCGGLDSRIGPPDASDADISGDGTVTDLPVDNDLSTPDAELDTPEEDVSTQPGLFGDPCESDEDCLDRFCIVGLEGEYICTVRCVDTCDEPGYACQLIEASGADLVRICYPQIFDLCKPCEEDFECGGLADRCVEIQDGTFCGSDCARSDVCPEGFDCRTYGEARQCVPSDNICSDCFDRDEDGYGEGDGCLGFDCRDLDPTVFEGAPELCDFKDNDCDNEVDEDIDTTTDPDHCGGCGQACELPNAINMCVASTCFIQECLPGFYDNDLDDPGCEYECVDEDFGIEDEPDRDFMDTNCDGIDGNVSVSVFVSASRGHPDGAGTLEDPVDDLWRGIEIAQSSGFSHVLVAQGAYMGRSTGPGGFEPVELVNGISVYGGYSAVNWKRAEGNLTAIGGNIIGLLAENIVDETVLANFTVQADSGSTLTGGEGESSIGLLCVNASGLVIYDSTILAGDGGNGDDGDDGRIGSDGGNGGDGGTGIVASCGCPDNEPTRGTTGTSSCRVGGRGGSAAKGTNTGGTGGAAGSIPGGSGGSGGEEFATWPTNDGEDGSRGCAASGYPSGCATYSSANGNNGVGGSAFGGVSASGYWLPSAGGDGQNGENGYGGGGGGGGGGATGSCSGGCITNFLGNCDGYGGAGGGGGGAGCRGFGGTAGEGGGGSFGLYFIDSSPIVENTQIVARNGGPGGDGGGGGRGGYGGDGGDGGGSNCNGGDGGHGGDGTDGGAGGHGGGGAGGVSFSIFLVDSSDDGFSTDNVTLWGSGGVPGRGPGNAGERGEAGAVRRVAR